MGNRGCTRKPFLRSILDMEFDGYQLFNLVLFLKEQEKIRFGEVEAAAISRLRNARNFKEISVDQKKEILTSELKCYLAEQLSQRDVTLETITESYLYEKWFVNNIMFP